MQSCFLEAVAVPSIWLEHRLAPARPPSARSAFGELLGHVPLTPQRPLVPLVDRHICVPARRSHASASTTSVRVAPAVAANKGRGRGAV